MKPADPLVAFELAIGEAIGRYVPTLFCVVDLETSNGLMLAAEEHMMLNRLLLVPGVEHSMLNMCLH